MIAKTLYFAYLTLAMVNQNEIPDRCSGIEGYQSRIHDAQWLTGYHDSASEQSLQLLEKKSEILDCTGKLHTDEPQYLRRKEFYDQTAYLSIMHCPELSKGIESFKNQQDQLTTTDQKLYDNLKDEHTKLQCQFMIHHHNGNHSHHHIHQTQGN